MRLTSQRGVSLMLLIIAITVFAAVAIGIVTLLRARHESYPYQVQSYQAYALAHAGVEFALRYATDNQADFFSNPTLYIPQSDPGKTISLGNGTFSLRYTPGCPDTLYSRGSCGTATREVQVRDFYRFAGMPALSVVDVSTVILDPDGTYRNKPGTYTQLRFGPCNQTPNGTVDGNRFVRRVRIASGTAGLSIQRFGIGRHNGTDYFNWMWDGYCQSGNADDPIDHWATAPNGTPTFTTEYAYRAGLDPDACTLGIPTCKEFNVRYGVNPETVRWKWQDCSGPPNAQYCNTLGYHPSTTIDEKDPYVEINLSGVVFGTYWFWIEIDHQDSMAGGPIVTTKWKIQVTR